MTVEQMRNQISEIYSGFTWKDRVEKMPDDQVIAIWHTFQERGTFDKPSAAKSVDGRRVKQLSVFDILKEKKKDD